MAALIDHKTVKKVQALHLSKYSVGEAWHVVFSRLSFIFLRVTVLIVNMKGYSISENHQLRTVLYNS